MRIIETKIYSFSELSDEAKEKAIESVRESYYESNDFAYWALDDCYLFEPKYEELIKLFGDGFYQKLNGGTGEPLIGNNRKDIYFSAGRDWFLDCTKAMEINNERYFLLWLGIPEKIVDDVQFNIYTPSGRNADTTITIEYDGDGYNEELCAAEAKFNEHIDDCLRRIERDIDYRFTDEAIIEDIEVNEIEFTEDGEKY